MNKNAKVVFARFRAAHNDRNFLECADEHSIRKDADYKQISFYGDHPHGQITYDPFPTIAKLRDKYIETPRDSILQLHLDRLLQRDANGELMPTPVTFTATCDTHGIALVEGAGGAIGAAPGPCGPIA